MVLVSLLKHYSDFFQDQRTKVRKTLEFCFIILKKKKKSDVHVLIDHCKIQNHLDFFSPPRNVVEHSLIFILSQPCCSQISLSSRFS